MDHFYQNIDGFMSHKNIIFLDIVLQNFPVQGTWVELGSWTGKSVAYCVVELLKKKALGKFYNVDKKKKNKEIIYNKNTKNINEIFDI